MGGFVGLMVGGAFGIVIRTFSCRIFFRDCDVFAACLCGWWGLDFRQFQARRRDEFFFA